MTLQGYTQKMRLLNSPNVTKILFRDKVIWQGKKKDLHLKEGNTEYKKTMFRIVWMVHYILKYASLGTQRFTDYPQIVVNNNFNYFSWQKSIHSTRKFKTKLRTFPCSSLVSQINLRRIGPGVPALWSDKQTDTQTEIRTFGYIDIDIDIDT